METNETDPIANCGFLVPIDAPSANVALARPVRVPDVRTAVSRVLGRAFAGNVV
jgi:hypothetical protein